jgi:hypothetical protein
MTMSPDEAEASFAGQLAKTANLKKLSLAEKLAAGGVDRGDIWNKTGWFQGADKKWRFEIPDNKAGADVESLKYDLIDPTKPFSLNSALWHEDISKAYPKMLETETSLVPGTKNYRVSGDTPPTVGIPEGASDATAKSSLLHELQHLIQREEGFARGANTHGLWPNTPAWDIYQERLRAMITPPEAPTANNFENWGADFANAQKNYNDNLNVLKGYEKKGFPSMLDRAAQDYAVNEAYRRAAGEVEARNVQKRMDMKLQERRKNPPWETQDVPEEEQIVRMHPIKHERNGGSVVNHAFMLLSKQGR